MSSDIWEKWLELHDKGFRIKGKKVLFLVDNARSHSTPETSNSNDKTQETEEDQLYLENDESGEVSNPEASNDGQHEELYAKPHGRPHGRPRTTSYGRSSKQSQKKK